MKDFLQTFRLTLFTEIVMTFAFFLAIPESKSHYFLLHTSLFIVLSVPLIFMYLYFGYKHNRLFAKKVISHLCHILHDIFGYELYQYTWHSRRWMHIAC